MFIDTHCHLDFKDFDLDRKEVIQRAKEEGIDYIINVGSSLEGSEKSLKLAKEYEFIFASVGFHPHEADNFNEEIKDKLKLLAQDKKVVAIGEVGLDYFKNYALKENQREVFSQLIDIAKELNLSLIIHSRQSAKDTLEILREKKPKKVVIHCFSYDHYFLETFLKEGFFISFTANITYKNAKELRQLVKETPLERIMLETDAPFLAPHPLRGKRNEPSYLRYLGEAISEIKGISLEELAQITTQNAKNFFNLNEK